MGILEKNRWFCFWKEKKEQTPTSYYNFNSDLFVCLPNNANQKGYEELMGLNRRLRLLPGGGRRTQ